MHRFELTTGVLSVLTQATCCAHFSVAGTLRGSLSLLRLGGPGVARIGNVVAIASAEVIHFVVSTVWVERAGAYLVDRTCVRPSCVVV